MKIVHIRCTYIVVMATKQRPLEQIDSVDLLVSGESYDLVIDWKEKM